MKRALVVDDNKIVRELLTAFVEHTDKFDEVDSVMSGEEAMDLFEPGKYKLVILDIGLVKMTGTEAAFMMRHLDKSVNIIAITGYSSILESCNLEEIGFNKCFLKPFGYVEFFDYVRDI